MIRYLVPLALMALVGCDKEMPDRVGHDGTVGHDDSNEVVFTFYVDEFTDADTKANTIGVADDQVYRIDIYSYDKDGNFLRHAALGGKGTTLDMNSPAFRDAFQKNEIRTYLFIANLDADSANYIARLSGEEVSSYPKGFIPWSAGNCRVNRPLMAATARVWYQNAEPAPVAIKLMRYMAKIEVEKITAQFWGDPDLWRDVHLNHIAITNGMDIVRICKENPKNFTGTPVNIFGSRGSVYGSPILGNLTEDVFFHPNQLREDSYYTGLESYSFLNGTFNLSSYGGRGKLAQDYAYLYNNNYGNTTKNSINLSCPEVLQELTQHSWTAPAGKICSSDGDADNYLNVNKVFYVLPSENEKGMSDLALNAAETQDWWTRLVLAIELDGKQYFYPMRLTNLQPNMLYRIKNITLKGEPTEYANAWALNGQVTKAGEMPGQAGNDVNQWRVHGNVAEIDNLVLEGCL